MIADHSLSLIIIHIFTLWNLDLYLLLNLFGFPSQAQILFIALRIVKSRPLWYPIPVVLTNFSLWLTIVVTDLSSFLAHYFLILRIGLLGKLLIGFMKDIQKEQFCNSSLLPEQQEYRIVAQMTIIPHHPSLTASQVHLMSLIAPSPFVTSFHLIADIR